MAAQYYRVSNKNNQMPKRPLTWFIEQRNILLQQNTSTTKLIASQKTTYNIVPGFLYLFGYDAKFKDTLPYWDSFPLILPYRKYKDGFLALNLHYAPIDFRVGLLENLQYIHRQTISEITKLRNARDLIESYSGSRYGRMCIHHYLNAHVKTHFKQINTDEWITAAMLPVQRFVGTPPRRQL